MALIRERNDTGQISNEGASGPTILLPDDETEEMIRYIDQQIKESEEKLVDMRADKEEEFLRWQSQSEDAEWVQPEIPGVLAHLDLDEVQGDTAVVSKPLTGRACLCDQSGWSWIQFMTTG